MHKRFLKNVGGEVEVLDGTGQTTRDLMQFMGDRFYLPLVAEGVEEARAKADALQEAVSSLTAQIVTRDRPLLFVEGPTDEILFNHLLERRGAGAALEVVALGSAVHAQRFAGMTEDLIRRILGERRGFLLLDSDRAGREGLPKHVDRPAARVGWVQSQNSLLWRLLPASQEAMEAFRAAGITDAAQQGTCLEDCYSAEVRARAMADGAYELGEPRPAARQSDLFLITPALEDDSHRFYLRSPAERRKVAFVNWLVANGEAETIMLNTLLDEILA